MSTATQEEQAIYIPSDEEVKTPTGAGAWRFGNGKICRGRQEDGTLITKDSVTGLLTRVGFYDHKLDTGKQIFKIECDLKLASGETFHLGADLLDDNFQFRPSMSALQFAHALGELTGQNEIIKITCSKGEDYTDEMGRQRKGSTYVNVFRVDAKQNVIKVEWPKKDKSAARESVKERWLNMSIDTKIKAHPLYKEREKREVSSSSAVVESKNLELFCKDCSVKGWPTPNQAPTEWLVIVGKIAQTTFGTLADVTDPMWAEIRKGFAERGMPKSLEPIKAQLDKAKSAAIPDDYDPFNDL